jgi:hypothetical protein
LSGNEISPRSDTDVAEYCREIERHLCQKNDGHLIRVVGPAFELVARWAGDGVPLKVALGGIDRCFERYYRKGARRRPVRVEFCEHDVLDVFDEWRRATGVGGGAVAGASVPASGRRGPSLPEHLERVLVRLTNARATGTLGSDADDLIDRLSVELDRARASSGGLRGDARKALVDRLSVADADLASIVRRGLARHAEDAVEREADAELLGFRDQMAPAALSAARARVVDRILRERQGLPTIAFD